MRKFVVMLSSLATMLVASLGLGTSAAAAADVLTTGSVGGANVAVGDTLTAPTSGNEVFNSGFVSITCTGGGTTGTVSSNPAAPSTATQTGTSLKFTPTNPGTCSSNLGNASVSGGAAGSLSVSEAAGTTTGTATVSGSSGSFTVFGNTCTYKVSSPQTGTTSNTDNSLTFTNIAVSLTTGTGGCSPTGTQTIKYTPVTDTSQGGAKVFVNN